MEDGRDGISRPLRSIKGFSSEQITKIQNRSDNRIAILQTKLEALRQETKEYEKSSLINLKDEIKKIALVAPLTQEGFKEKNELTAKTRVAAITQAEITRLKKMKVNYIETANAKSLRNASRGRF